MKIVVLGLTITSSWGNGHATTFRSLLKALRRRGHSIIFFEKDTEWYRSHCDMPRPEFCKVVLYKEWSGVSAEVLRESRDADAVVLGSYFPDAIQTTEEMLDAGIAPLLFYDIDTPITMAALRAKGQAEYLKASSIPHYAAYMSFTGGPVLADLQERFGSPLAAALYCSVDPELHRKARVRDDFRCDLSYLGTYAKDRQAKLMELLNRPALLLSHASFVVAGPQYPEHIAWVPNVRRINHVSPPDHAAFYSSSRFTLNLTRKDMIIAGYSPSVRLFEAAACGSAIISDPWRGLEEFFNPGDEILLARDGDTVADILTQMSRQEAIEMGRRARERVLTAHTAAHRAVEFERIVEMVYSADRGCRSLNDSTQKVGASA